MANQHKKIIVLGLGGGGGKIVATLAADEQAFGDTVTLAAADTDHAALEQLAGVVQIPLGKEWAYKGGCGGNSTKGEKAAAASSDDLRQLVAGADQVIVVAGFGRGTGAGAARVLARHLRELEIMNLFVITQPFSFEGHWPCHQAAKDMEVLRGICDTAMSIPNDLLFADLPANTVAARAFEASNLMLAKGIRGLVMLPEARAILPVDFAALRNLLKEKPDVCTLGFGNGSGPDRWQEVVRNFFACPLVGGTENLAKTDAAVLTLVGGDDLSVGEIQACMSALQKQFPPTARILVGAYSDNKLRNSVQLTGLICRFSGEAAIPQKAMDVAKNAGAVVTPRRSPARKPTTTDGQQGELALQEQALGIFAGSPPTTVDTENLDIPTFQRRGVYLDIG